MCVSITPPEWYRKVVFGGPGPRANWFSRKEVLEERLLNFLEDKCSSFNRDVFFFCNNGISFGKKVDEECIEELKAKGENENTKNSTEVVKYV